MKHYIDIYNLIFILSDKELFDSDLEFMLDGPITRENDSIFVTTEVGETKQGSFIKKERIFLLPLNATWIDILCKLDFIPSRNWAKEILKDLKLPNIEHGLEEFRFFKGLNRKILWVWKLDPVEMEKIHLLFTEEGIDD